MALLVAGGVFRFATPPPAGGPRRFAVADDIALPEAVSPQALLVAVALPPEPPLTTKGEFGYAQSRPPRRLRFSSKPPMAVASPPFSGQAGTSSNQEIACAAAGLRPITSPAANHRFPPGPPLPP